MTLIATANLPVIKDRVAKINRRAEKLGVEGVTLEYGETRILTERDEMGRALFRYPAVEVTVVGPTVKINGWTFVASIDHSEGIVKSIPDAPEGLRAYVAEPDCGHCKLDRRRNTTYILSNEDELIQVGSGCVKDFLGHEVSLSIFEASFELEDEFESMGSGGELGYALETFLAVTSASIRNFGWVSRSDAREQMTSSTSDDVLTFFRRAFKLDITEDDEKIAAETIEWAKSLDPYNDYLGNIKQVAENNYVTYKSAGLAASMINAYKKAVQTRIEREAEVTSPVPEDRLQVTGKVVKTDWKEGFQGDSRYVMIVLDDRGFRVWGTVPKAIASKVEAGVRVTFLARLERSDRDETFGFFSRPSKAAIV